MMPLPPGMADPLQLRLGMQPPPAAPLAEFLEPAGVHRLFDNCHRAIRPGLHVHDEAVIEEPLTSSATVESICQLMATPPAWADGLPLDADGYDCAFYKKD